MEHGGLMKSNIYEDFDRYPVLNGNTFEIINISYMQKSMSRGTYICSECYSITKDIKKSAVFLKGGNGFKVKSHACHFSKEVCGSPNAIHVKSCKAIEFMTFGELEAFYPDSNFKCDVKSGNDYWEVVNTSDISQIKRDYIYSASQKYNLNVFRVSIRKIPHQIIQSMWDLWHKHKHGSEDGWQSFWFDNLKKYSKKLEKPKPKNKNLNSFFTPIDDGMVGHFSRGNCHNDCENAIDFDGKPCSQQKQKPLIYSCKFELEKDLEFNQGVKCPRGLGKKVLND
jgi:hypothetical protein